MKASTYHALNNLLAHIATHGEINASHHLVAEAIRAMNETDGGVYNPQFGKRTKAISPPPEDLLMRGKGL
jgi:hypothetical protein